MARRWWNGAALRRARMKRKMTQIALAAKVGVHNVSLSRIETGERNPSIALVYRLARTLKVPVAELLELK